MHMMEEAAVLTFNSGLSFRNVNFVENNVSTAVLEVRYNTTVVLQDYGFVRNKGEQLYVDKQALVLHSGSQDGFKIHEDSRGDVELLDEDNFPPGLLRRRDPLHVRLREVRTDPCACRHMPADRLTCRRGA